MRAGEHSLNTHVYTAQRQLTFVRNTRKQPQDYHNKKGSRNTEPKLDPDTVWSLFGLPVTSSGYLWVLWPLATVRKHAIVLNGSVVGFLHKFT